MSNCSDGGEQGASEQPRFEVFARGLDHPECVVVARDGSVWAGGEAGQIYRIDPSGSIQTVTTLGGFVAGIAFSPLDQALYACIPKLGLMRVEANGRHDLFLADILCANYPVFDRRGRLYVSDSGKWKQRDGFLMKVDSNGSGQVIGGPYGYANGLALTADERWLFMVESDTDRIYRFELTSDGQLGPAEIFGEVSRFPDGLALDEAGNLYVACYASDEIWRISPAGEKSRLAWDYHAILLSRPTNLAWGGARRDMLYVANLGRDTITRARLSGVSGQRLAHQYD